MSSPSAARAEARRKAILGRGSDRLAKLTTSARGEDASSYIQTGIPARTGASTDLASFTGEETPPLPHVDVSRTSPSPPSVSGAAAAPASADPQDPSAWTDDQQRQLMQALMGGGGAPRTPFSLPHQSQPSADADPMSTFLAQLAQANQAQGQSYGPAAAAKPPVPPMPPSRFQNLIPLIHALCMWFLLGFFVLWKEPGVYAEKTGVHQDEIPMWRRWQMLGYRRPEDEGGWGVQLVPFFWALMTLEIMLHTIRVFTGHAQPNPPKLLALAIHHLPPPIPSLIMDALRYLQLGNSFVDDVAMIVFGIGVVVMAAGWAAA
ncbi:hypothetical protein BKA82DRAFT_723380 [Pisolithus tinctorius]|uniref:Golgi to ER traffic protein 2 n=1 Tax=Pisolithus tinctorius Marx 270 TaxID=870435 RepID=A0A0C3JW57_PISTI|nr:hypothetical protein BKA82DRAFT_723380 [Pisolithus tinctorius]KIO01692.1 hypothetical protein M404DRAFT_723380 [Pisolithus tinctorius Marx 270]